MVESPHLRISKDIQQRTGKTFHVATRLLPPRVKEATYVLYAFFRTADEVVDDPDGPPPEHQRAELERIRAAALGERETTDPVLSEFATLRQRYGIDADEVNAFVDAMAMDVDATDYETFADLREYLRGSSVAVGYMMLSVMDDGTVDVEDARPHAKALGEAFQLTNFLRDVREDVLDYDRVYLPQETLDRHGVDRTDVERLRYSEGFAAAMAAEMRRTEALYRTGVAGIASLPEDCRFGVLLAAVLYADHHRRIRARRYDVLSERPTLSTGRRLWLAARTWLHWRATGDPETVFYRVSPVDPVPTGVRRVDDRSFARGDDRPLARVVRPAKRAVDGLLSAVRPRLWG